VLDQNATANLTINGFKSYLLYNMAVNTASWVRLYTDATARSADLTRVQGIDPTPGSGVLAEIITTSSYSQLISPGVVGFNNDATTSTNIYAAVTNLAPATSAVTVTLNVLPLEQ
jgi:hypothetical protein